jgi:putative transposase
MAEVGQADRRNGCYTRWLLTELGTIELAVPRTRTFSALKVVRAYTRASQGRRSHDPRLLSARALDLQVAIALLPILGWPVSPVTVSAVAKQLNAALAVFHRRPLKGIHRVLVLDGVVLNARPAPARWRVPCWSPSACPRTARGRSSTSVWRPPRAPPSGSCSWATSCAAASSASASRCSASTVARACSAAPPAALPEIPVQRCWAHKIRNMLNKVRKLDQAAIKADLHRIMNATILPAAWSAARRFADLWAIYPKAVACLRADLDDLVTCFRYPTLKERRAVRTTDEIDKSFLLVCSAVVCWCCTGDRVAKSEAAAGSLAGLPDQDEPTQLRRTCAGRRLVERARARRGARPSTRLARRAARLGRRVGGATLHGRLGLPLGHELIGTLGLLGERHLPVA